MTPERSIEQREQDARLAWIIVAGCALLTLVLLVGLYMALRGPVARWAASSWDKQMEDARARERVLAAGAERGTEADTPLDVAVGTPPPDSTRPLGDPARWIGPDDYPVYALRNGDEGRVRVTVSVSPAGVPLGCAVRRSSGHWSLDNATCAAMLNHGRFTSARKAKMRRYWTSPFIRWQLPDHKPVAARASA